MQNQLKQMTTLISNNCRLDQWLVAARFYKTRALAVAAIKNGRVLVNGNRAKPARQIAINDMLHIEKTSEQHFDIIVEQLETKRPSAKIAVSFYTETLESIAKRETLRERQSLARKLIDFPTHRPNKRDRRKLRDIHRQPFD